ncbi:hypothetical protein O181_064891 [Austropuccinia psidii MF-1]|uniref:Uncharacterized protein n=1 Tax=Austropuccinia psidii MF-1 TaxID=1389203 RepID=A0A9Q3I0R4_9BASI|nr:hypothetical protein [Austropuccinia psidii MF-1]
MRKQSRNGRKSWLEFCRGTLNQAALEPFGRRLRRRSSGLLTTSTSSQSNSSLASASESGEELVILLILLTMFSVLILEIWTSELEYIGLPPTGIDPPTWVHLATSLFLEPITNSRYQYPIQSVNSFNSQS